MGWGTTLRGLSNHQCGTLSQQPEQWNDVWGQRASTEAIISQSIPPQQMLLLHALTEPIDHMWHVWIFCLIKEKVRRYWLHFIRLTLWRRTDLVSSIRPNNRHVFKNPLSRKSIFQPALKLWQVTWRKSSSVFTSSSWATVGASALSVSWHPETQSPLPDPPLAPPPPVSSLQSCVLPLWRSDGELCSSGRRPWGTEPRLRMFLKLGRFPHQNPSSGSHERCLEWEKWQADKSYFK